MAEPKTNKYYTSESVELQRSQIHFADYNPRRITAENLKTLKKGIKKFGLVGGIVVNSRTGNTLVSGHQRLTAMDELQKYDPETGKNDYKVRCDLVDIDEVAEKELLILLNNPNAQGEWDNDILADLIKQIDYTNAGLTEYDLTAMGVVVKAEDYTLPTIDLLNTGQKSEPPTSGNDIPDSTPTAERVEQSEQAERKEPVRDGHIYDRKREIAGNMDKATEKTAAFLMVEFETLAEMTEFLAMFDYPDTTQIIKGKEFLNRLEC